MTQSVCATWVLDVCIIASDRRWKNRKNRKLWLRSREKAAGFFFSSRLAAVASLSPFVAGHAHSPQPRCPHTSAGAPTDEKRKKRDLPGAKLE